MKTNTSIKRLNPESKAVKPVSWKPASRLGNPIKPEGFRMRWCEDSPENISKKKAEGWEILDKTKFPELANSDYEQRVTDAHGETTILKRNELVAMVLPEEKALARDEYYRQETADRSERAFSKEEVKRLLSKSDPRGARNVFSINPNTGED
jgi:hypothetical protein